MTNVALRESLEVLERKWTGILQTKLVDDQLWPATAGSDVQFFSIDFPSPLDLVEPKRNPLLIAAVEINYKAYPGRFGRNGVPHISTETHGLTWVVDNPKKTRGTRRALKPAMISYAKNQDTWVENGYASTPNLIKTDDENEIEQLPIVLLKTYLSPFLLAKPWMTNSRSLQAATLAAWDPNQHICDLIKELGKDIDLWVIAGTSLWPHFNTASSEIPKWILTPALSLESQRNRSIETHWKSPRRKDQQRLPLFPLCGS